MTGAETPGTPSPQQLAEAALYYAGTLGWSVIPLHSATGGRCSCPDPGHDGKPGGARCPAPGKHPRTIHGLHDASKSPAQVAAWWKRWPDSNVGVVTGKASGFVVVDMDVKPATGKDGPARLAELEKANGPIPPTMASVTGGGGRHLLFAFPEGELNNSNDRIGLGIDVRGSGGYIVAPPSVHASGRVYTWDEGALARPLAPLPPWLLERARRALRVVAASSLRLPDDHPLSSRIKRARAYLSRMDPSISGQDGHGALWAASLALTRGFDLPYDVALSLICEEFNPRCKPPWSLREIQHKVDDASNDASASAGYLLDPPGRQRPAPATAPRQRPQAPPPAEPVDMSTPFDDGPDGRAGETPMAATKVAETRGVVLPFRPKVDDEPGMVVFERGDHVELADWTLQRLGPHPLTHDCGEFYRYDPARGIWEMLPGPAVRTTVATFAGAPISMEMPNGKRKEDQLKIGASTVKGTETIMKDRLRAGVDPIVFADAPPGVVFADGFATVKCGVVTLHPHSPAHRARHCFPFPYVAEAPTPMLDEFFEGIFQDCSEEERADRVALIQEFIGVCLIGEATKYERCLVLFATGGNGKSEILRIMRGLFPEEAVTSIAPQRWGDRFRTALLVGKLANFVDELPEAEIMSGESFKAIVTGNPIDVDVKNKDPFTFVPKAGHVMCTNSPISTADHTDGFWRRPLILPLTHNFEGDANRRHTAGAEVLAAEHAAIVSWALRGAARRQSQSDYTIPGQSRAIAKEWRDDSDVVRIFAASRPDVEDIRASELYEQYKEWSKRNGYGQMSINKFGRRLVASKLYRKQEKAMGLHYIRGGM